MSAPRKELRRIEGGGEARYLTFSCYRGLQLFNNDAIKDAFAAQLILTRQRMAFALLAWVVMPEHVHLLVQPRPDGATVSRLLLALKRPLATQVLARWRELEAPILARLNDRSGQAHFWQPGGGYDRNIASDPAVRATIEYIHANPVRRGLVNESTQWQWSSARWYAGQRENEPRIDLDAWV